MYYLTDGEFTDKEFHDFWQHGVPIVVTNVQMQGRWMHADFIEDYGSRKVSVLDCTDGADLKTRRCTMAEFFSILSTPGSPQGRYKMKVRQI